MLEKFSDEKLWILQNPVQVWPLTYTIKTKLIIHVFDVASASLQHLHGTRVPVLIQLWCYHWKVAMSGLKGCKAVQSSMLLKQIKRYQNTAVRGKEPLLIPVLPSSLLSDYGSDGSRVWEQHSDQHWRGRQLPEVSAVLLRPEPPVPPHWRGLGLGLQSRPEGEVGLQRISDSLAEVNPS